MKLMRDCRPIIGHWLMTQVHSLNQSQLELQSQCCGSHMIFKCFALPRMLQICGIQKPLSSNVTIKQPIEMKGFLSERFANLQLFTGGHEQGKHNIECRKFLNSSLNQLLKFTVTQRLNIHATWILIGGLQGSKQRAVKLHNNLKLLYFFEFLMIFSHTFKTH